MLKLIRWSIIVGVCLLRANFGLSEILVPVSGNISGDWGSSDDAARNSDTVYVIEGPSCVDYGAYLNIHAGIRVEFACTELCTVRGGFKAAGSAQFPIRIRMLSEGEGFRFEGAAEDTVFLGHVLFSSHGDSIPFYALTSYGRPLEVVNCEIWAERAAIWCERATVKIDNCRLFKTGGGDACVWLENALRSQVKRNKVKVDFPPEKAALFTEGIHISSCAGAEIDSNVIEIIGVGFITGIYGEFDCSPLSICQDSIYATTETEAFFSQGIWLASTHNCSIAGCTVSVDSKNSGKTVILLSGRTTAFVTNSALNLTGGVGGRFIHQVDGAAANLSGCTTYKESIPSPNDGHDENSDEILIGTAFPNPFNSTTVMSLELPQASVVEVIVFNVLGREETRFSYGMLPSGYHQLTLSGKSWTSGVYFINFIIDGKPMATRKVVLVK